MLQDKTYKLGTG